jgi:2-amino-4-hydroxy-6-hydroxymethyldihydropteridine diphosphokinase
MSGPTVAYVALGANLPGRHGPPAVAIEAALAQIDRDVGPVVARSRLYRSLAWPDPNDPDYVNAVAAVETREAAAAFLARLHTIEADFGRIRGAVNAARPLDLDIVDFGGRVSGVGAPPLLPHPRMAERPFVLLPLQEIAPGWRHPVTGRTIGDLVAALPRPLSASLL